MPYRTESVHFCILMNSATKDRMLEGEHEGYEDSEEAGSTVLGGLRVQDVDGLEA